MQFPLAPVAEIPEEGAKKVDFFGREVILYRVDGQPKAVMNVCLHLGGPLEQVDGKFVCAWHKAEWDMKNGKLLTGPARPDSRLMFLPTRVIDGVLNYIYGE
jgi:nitrite reductase/ring-hydroxylating ferredoxin subunit